jgi:hypothetical protein
MIWCAHLSRKNRKGFVNVQPFRAKEISPPLLTGDDNNIVLYPRDGTPSTKQRRNQSNRGLTYVQESKLKQPLICDSKSPGEKVVALPQEGGDMRERETREGGRSILVVLIAATEKQNREKQAKSHQGEQRRNSMFPKELKER